MGRRVVQVLPGPYYNVTEATGQGCIVYVRDYGTYTINRLPEPLIDPLCFKTGLYAVLSPSLSMVQRNFPDTVFNCNTSIRVRTIQDYGCNKRIELVQKGRIFNQHRHIALEKKVMNYGGYVTPYAYYETVESWYNHEYDTNSEADSVSTLWLQPGQYRAIATSGPCSDTVYFDLQTPSCQPFVNVLSTSPASNCYEGSIRFEFGGSECGSNTWIYKKSGNKYVFAYPYPFESYGASHLYYHDNPGDYMLINHCVGTPNMDTAYATIGATVLDLSINATNASTPSAFAIRVEANPACNPAYPLTLRNLANNDIITYYIPPNPVTINVPVAGTYEVRVFYLTSQISVYDTVVVAMPPSPWPIAFGAANDDYVKGVVQDGSGNVYASISFRGTINLGGTSLTSASATRRDMALAKFNSSGQLLWVKKMGNGTFDMEPQGVNLDGAGNPYWAGSFAGSITFPGAPNVALTAAGSYDAFTARFDPGTGNCLWAKRVGGSGNDYLFACFVSNSGNVYAGGSYTGSIVFQTGTTGVTLPNAGGLDGFIVKFDASGNGLYASRMGSTANDEVKSIAYNGGDLVACGYMGNNCTFPTGTNAAPGTTTLATINGSRDGWTARINSTGHYVWVKNFGTIFNDEATSICMDPSTGNVITAAQVADSPMSFNSAAYPGFGGNDIAVLVWNFYTQAPVWANRMGSTGGDSPTGVSFDGQQRIVVSSFVGGAFKTYNTIWGGLGGQDGAIIRLLKNTGAVTSKTEIGNTGDDRALALWVNQSNRQELVGGVFSNWADLWELNGPRQYRASNGGLDGFICRISPPINARESADESEVMTPATMKAYPQPVTSGGSLTVLAIEGGPARLLDMHGRLVKTIDLKAGENTIEVPHNPGLYLLRTSNGATKIVVE